MFALLAGLPGRVWAVLALIVLVPPIVGLVGLALARRLTLDIATRLASRAAAIMGFGFGVLAIVAVLFVLNTGLREIRRRHLPTVVTLARAVSARDTLPAAELEIEQELALFRAREPDAGPAVAWYTRCGTACLAASGETHLELVREWGLHQIRHPPDPRGLHVATFANELHLVIPAALRDAAGAPAGYLLVSVRARWVADRALQTAGVLVTLAYVLLLSVWWITRRMIGRSVATRVKRIAARIRTAEAGGRAHDTPVSEVRDELSLLDRVVAHHILDSVARLRQADQQASEARALAARMEATATLAAGVAHDFNNLMTGIMANSEVLRRERGDDPQVDQTLDTIMECAQRGGRLAQQLLAFARGGKYQPVAVDVNAVVRDTLRVEAHTVPRGVEVRAELADDLAAIEADPTQLSQVVSNLHRNGVEALGGTGTLTITTRNLPADHPRPAALQDLPAGAYVVLTVADSGPGMSADTREHIFEPFFTTKVGGRGLGLAATYGIVLHHAGMITVDSPEGGGTCFAVYLPASSRPAAPALVAPRISQGSRLGGTVLVVDDEAAILMATTRLLASSGYRVLSATGGREAIALAERPDTLIDVILLDLRMPDLSGAQAFGPLTAAQPHAIVILCSGYELDAAARTLLDRGAAEFIQKPFRLQDLTAAIDRAVVRRVAGLAAQPS